MLDICVWAIQKMRGMIKTLPTHISGHAGIYWLDDAKEVPDTQVVTYDFGDFMLVWELHSFENHSPLEGIDAGIAFYGTEATLVFKDRGWQVIGKDGNVVATEKATRGSHTQTFFESIKSRKVPNSDVETGRISTMICHLGNISSRLGRDLTFDPQTETFREDTEANAFLTKEYREPFTLPGV